LKKYYCIDCNKEISLKAKRCKRCAEINLPKSIKRIHYEDIWMRSSWEVAYAKYCDKNKIKWEYEPKIFDLGKSRYIPDFYLPESDTYVEIKGRWYPGTKRKFRLFQKKYYSVNIILLTKKELKKLKIIK
jgi:predicted nuclease of restriction endonuclease-like RecB superfamily